MEQRLMPDPLDIRENTFTNLLLLGFQPNVYEAKHKCPFNRDSFVFPNKKAFEAVFYFLFVKLNPDVARDEFRNCWPILDKKQESAFRKVVAGWLNRISKESHDSHMPRIVASVLLSPGGDKFYQLLFCFSTYVLREELRKTVGRHDIILPWPSNSSATKSLLNQISKILKTKAAWNIERSLQTVHISASAQDQWILYASELTKDNRTLRKKKREIERILKDLESEHLQRGLLSPASRVSSNGSPNSGQIKSLKRTKILQRVRGFRKHIEEMYESHKILREKMDEIMKGSANKHCLKGADIDLKIPDLLIRECEEEIYQKRIGNTYESGRINLLSLVQLWNLSLHLILEQVRSYPLPSLSEEEADVREKLHAQSAYLESTKSLKEILEVELIPELKESIEELQETVEMSETLKKQQTPKTSLKGFDFGLIGLPSTPSVRLNTDSEYNQTVDRIAFTKQLFTEENGTTPEAIEKMMQSLRNATLVATPDSNAQMDTSEKPPQPRLDRKSKIPQHLSKPRLPVTKAKSTVKQKTRSKMASRGMNGLENVTFIDITPKRKELQPNQLNSKKIAGKIAADILQDKSYEAQGGPVEKAHEILAEKVASFVLSHGEVSGRSSSSSSSSRSATPLEHGLEDPISAMGQDAFQAVDKIKRTPLTKEKEKPRASVDAFESYLIASMKQRGFTPETPVRLFSESLAESPLGGASYSGTPRTDKKTDSFPPSSNYNQTVDIFRDKVESGEGFLFDPESPEFDANFQTPQVKRAIESSVMSSIHKRDADDSFSEDDSKQTLTPKSLHSNFTLEWDTPKYGIKNSERKDLSRLDSAKNGHVGALPINSTNSEALQEFRKPRGNDYRITSPIPNAKSLAERLDQDSIEMSTKNSTAIFEEIVDDVSKSRVEELGTSASDKTGKEEHEKRGNKEYINQLIQKYKNLKIQSKKSFVYPEEFSQAQKSMPTDVPKMQKLNEQNSFNGEADEKEARTFSTENDFRNDDPVSAHNSFLEIARKSASKDVITWADLKKSFAADESMEEEKLPEQSNFHDKNPEYYEHETHRGHDSFEDLRIPVAQQLSFLQLDTRDFSADNVLGLSHTGKDSTLTPDAKYTLDDLPNDIFDQRSFQNSPKLKDPTLQDTASKRLKFETDDNFTQKISQTPVTKNLTDNDDFNLLTPGLELKKGLELFSFDVESPEDQLSFLGRGTKKTPERLNLI